MSRCSVDGDVDNVVMDNENENAEPEMTEEQIQRDICKSSLFSITSALLYKYGNVCSLCVCTLRNHV